MVLLGRFRCTHCQGAVNIFEIHHKNLFLCYFSALKKGKYTQNGLSMRMKLMEKETSAQSLQMMFDLPFVRDHLAFKTSLRGGPFSEVSLHTLQGAVNIFEIHHKNLFLCYFSALKKGKYTQTWISMRMKLMEKETSAWKKSFAVGNMWGTASDTWKGMVRFEVLYQS